MANYPVAEELVVSLEELEAMKEDPTITLVKAIAQPWSDSYIAFYWKNERGVLPPWVKISA